MAQDSAALAPGTGLFPGKPNAVVRGEGFTSLRGVRSMRFAQALFVFWILYFIPAHGHKCWAAEAPKKMTIEEFKAGVQKQAKELQDKRERDKKADEARFKQKYGDNTLYGAILEAPKYPAKKSTAKK